MPVQPKILCGPLNTFLPGEVAAAAHPIDSSEKNKNTIAFLDRKIPVFSVQFT